MKNCIYSIAHVCLFAGITCSAQSTDPVFVKDRLETVAESYASGNEIMGRVLVVEGDRTLMDKSYGMADLEWNIPNAPDVKFRLCSVTKQFTAALVLLLQEDGLLSISDPAAKYLPDAPKSWEKITLAQLLGHTSGIPELIKDKEFSAWSMSPRTPAEEFAFFRSKPLDFEPGARFAYSNSNFIVLGLVIEKVSGQSYGDLLRKRILLPLGMKDSGLDTDELILPKRSQGYNRNKNGLTSARQSMSMTVPWAAGSMYSTTGDLLLWGRALFGGKVLNDASLRAMTTAGTGSYGLGVEVTEIDGLKVVKQNGGLPGFSAQVTYVPERKIAIIVLSNVYGPAAAAMGPQLLNIVLGKPVVLSSERKSEPIAKDQLERFTGVYDVAPGFAITITAGGDSLMAQGSSQPKPMRLMYQGAAGGKARFYVPDFDAEIEFAPDAAGNVNSLILRQGGEHLAKKR